MKQVISIIGALLYLLTSTGVFASVHTCHGNVTEVNILDNDKDCCSTNKSTSHNTCDKKFSEEHKCCSDSEIFIKYDSISQITVEKLVLTKIQSIICNCTFHSILHIAQNEDISITVNKSPPIQKDLTTLYCTFTFYG